VLPTYSTSSSGGTGACPINSWVVSSTTGSVTSHSNVGTPIMSSGDRLVKANDANAHADYTFYIQVAVGG